MEVSIKDSCACQQPVKTDPAKHQLASCIQPETIAIGSIREHQSITTGNACDKIAIGAFDPGLDGKILQLQVGRVAQLDTRAVAIKYKTLAHLTCTIGRAAAKRTIDGTGKIEGIAFARPPTDKAGRDGDAVIYREHSVGTRSGTQGV